MTAITYVAAFDPFHAIFRTISLLQFGIGITPEIDRVRIFDFYLCFPQLIEKFEGVRDIPGFIKAKNRTKIKYPDNPYLTLPPPKQLFKRMEQHQLAGFSTLAASGFLNTDAFHEEIIVKSTKALTDRLEGEVTRFLGSNAELFDLIGLMSQLPLSGPNGLKKRSDLEEFRYDAI
jgi:hypothetical protein